SAAAELAETDAGMKTAIVDNPTVASSRPSFVSDLAELVKARLTLLVLLTTAVGFYLGAEPPIDYKALFQTVFGTAAAAAGAAALNPWWERRADGLTPPKKTRPQPRRRAQLRRISGGNGEPTRSCGEQRHDQFRRGAWRRFKR